MSTILSARTLSIMQNFASISPSIVLQPGKVLRSINDAGTLMGAADIEEDFPHVFPILDITKLLSILKVKSFKDCKLEFTDKVINIKGEHAELSFHASAKELTEMPEEGITLPSIDFQAEITAESLGEFIRISGVLSHKTAKLVAEGGKTYMVATTPELENSNDFKLMLGETDKPDCVMPLDVSNLKMMDSGYIIKGCSELEVVSFESTDGSLRYIVGIQLA